MLWTLLLTYLGGVLTIFSPCVLPVVPFVFSRADQPFRRSGLPLLVGMGFSFAIFAVLSVTGGRWVIAANQTGRVVALILFSILGFTLLSSRFATLVAAPFVRLGGSLQKRADGQTGWGSSLLMGTSVGLLWAPCAGPILGLVLAGATLGGSTQTTFGLLLVFALGAATSLAVALFAGAAVLRTLKKGLGAEEWIKRVLGAVVLISVFAISTGLDTRFLSAFSFVNTNSIEQSLVERFRIGGKVAANRANSGTLLNDEGPMPSLSGASDWLNSKPLTTESLLGKVVLIDFWTYSCINCLRTLPYLRAWAERYGPQGLVIIGVHSPEFAFERVTSNVKKAVADFDLHYPIAVDSDLNIWSAFQNQYWPAHYFVDVHGRVRFHHFGEGEYARSEEVIQQLLAEANPKAFNNVSHPIPVARTILKPTNGLEMSAASVEHISPETYLGLERQTGFRSTPSPVLKKSQHYQISSPLLLNEWGLKGQWTIASEKSVETYAPAELHYRFIARDVHLVIGSTQSRPIRFRVLMDGHPPGANHGDDTDDRGYGQVSGHRLYQLLRLRGSDAQINDEHTFSIEFLDSGAEVYAFTFG